MHSRGLSASVARSVTATLLALAKPSVADTPPEPPPENATSAPATPAPVAAPYSLPFQLRPAAAGTVLRSDTALAFYKPDAATSGGSTVATTLLGSYKVTPEFAPLVRLGLVHNSPPGPSAPGVPGTGTAVTNPVVGATYALKPSPDLRLAFFLGVTIPVGSGGGDNGDPATRAALAAGAAARSAMDNAMFAVNYLAVFPGVDIAWVSKGFTLQGEATFFELGRVRGAAKDADTSRTNLTLGSHAGYFFIPALSVGVELRHQRWLSTPAAVTAVPAARDTTTLAAGIRLHFELSDNVWFRPALAYARGLDEPMTDANYNIVQLDLPFSF